MRKIFVGLMLAALAPTAALAQSSPGLVFGQVPTAAQWNSYFAAKQDVLGFTPVNKAGDVMIGTLVTAPANASLTGFNITPGTAPTTPANGDMWTTSSGLFVQINGTTIGPLSGATSSSFAADPSLLVTFPSGVVTYALNLAHSNTWTASQTLSINQNALTQWIVSNTTTGTGSAAEFTATSDGARSMNFGTASSTFTTALIAGRGFMQGNTSIALHANVASGAVVMGVNGTETGRFQAGFSVGTTADPGSGSILANSAVFGTTQVIAGTASTAIPATLAVHKSAGTNFVAGAATAFGGSNGVSFGSVTGRAIESDDFLDPCRPTRARDQHSITQSNRTGDDRA